MTWRVARSLLVLREQVNKLHPDRSKINDGTIGDEAHASRTSDHNPWVKEGDLGIVTAMDITHDPLHGVDSYAMAENLRRNRDPRIKYVISNRRIFSGETHLWEWRPYNGVNPHDHHVHISVKPSKVFYDDLANWNLDGGIGAPPVKEWPILKKGATGDDVRRLQSLLKGLEVDGAFGEKTQAAVVSFQSSNSLVPDGIVGFYTWTVLNKGEK